jgi:hypothetical protein
MQSSFYEENTPSSPPPRRPVPPTPVAAVNDIVVAPPPNPSEPIYASAIMVPPPPPSLPATDSQYVAFIPSRQVKQHQRHKPPVPEKRLQRANAQSNNHRFSLSVTSNDSMEPSPFPARPVSDRVIAGHQQSSNNRNHVIGKWQPKQQQQSIKVTTTTTTTTSQPQPPPPPPPQPHPNNNIRNRHQNHMTTTATSPSQQPTSRQGLIPAGKVTSARAAFQNTVANSNSSKPRTISKLSSPAAVPSSSSNIVQSPQITSTPSTTQSTSTTQTNTYQHPHKDRNVTPTTQNGDNRKRSDTLFPSIFSYFLLSTDRTSSLNRHVSMSLSSVDVSSLISKFRDQQQQQQQQQQ